jgi:hypothetical protein
MHLQCELLTAIAGPGRLRINEFYKPGTTCRQVQRACRPDCWASRPGQFFAGAN